MYLTVNHYEGQRSVADEDGHAAIRSIAQLCVCMDMVCVERVCNEGVYRQGVL